MCVLQTAFKNKDQDNSGNFNSYELRAALHDIGKLHVTVRLHALRVIRLNSTSRHDTTHTSCRARRDERVDPCLFQHGGRQRSSSARVYKFSLLCSGFAKLYLVPGGC